MHQETEEFPSKQWENAIKEGKGEDQTVR